MSAGIISTVDVVAVVAIVLVAAAFLVSRFVDRQKPGGGGEVVVGAALAKGLKRARRRR